MCNMHKNEGEFSAPLQDVYNKFACLFAGFMLYYYWRQVSRRNSDVKELS